MPNLSLSQASDVLRRLKSNFDALEHIEDVISQAREAERHLPRVKKDIAEAESRREEALQVVERLEKRIQDLENSYKEKKISEQAALQAALSGMKSENNQTRKRFQVELAGLEASVKQEQKKTDEVVADRKRQVSTLNKDINRLKDLKKSVKSTLAEVG